MVLLQKRKLCRMGITEDQNFAFNTMKTQTDGLIHTGNTESIDAHLGQLFGNQIGTMAIGFCLDCRHETAAFWEAGL